MEMARLIELFSINEVVRSYQDTLERYVVDAANGNMTASTIMGKMRDLILSSSEEVYIEGLREGGVKDPELDDEDKRTIRDWVLEQVQHIESFADACVAVSKLQGDDKTSARNTMLDRVELWVTSIRNLGNLATLNAKGDPYLTYDGDDGQESCVDCQKYKGQRHKKSWWEKRSLLDRPNQNYECGRYENCHHHFFDDDGEQVMD